MINEENIHTETEETEDATEVTEKGLQKAKNAIINAIDENGAEFIDVTKIAWENAVQIRGLVGILYLVSGLFIFVGLGLVYNLDKKTLAKMNEELEARHAAEN